MGRHKKLLRWGFIILAVPVVAFLLLRWQGLLLFPNEAEPKAYELFGVDVSSYQGEVDWPKLAEQGVDFAFIKATEGSGHTDRYFAANWENAGRAGVTAGAYHFFSYDSPGETQADNFIAAVPLTEEMLPPVVDIEYYGTYLTHPMGKEETWAILDPLLAGLEEHYGVKPILYVTYESYLRYIAGADYGDYPLWFSFPVVAPLANWTFWQYSHTARLEGYVGSEEKIDLNVFRGTAEEFAALGK